MLAIVFLKIHGWEPCKYTGNRALMLKDTCTMSRCNHPHLVETAKDKLTRQVRQMTRQLRKPPVLKSSHLIGWILSEFTHNYLSNGKARL